MKTRKTWIGDIRAGLEMNENFTPIYFNDVTPNQRRIKFYTNKPLTVGRLDKLQQIIEKRRPHLSVTVVQDSNPLWNQTCVYYRPKVQTNK